MDRQIKKDTKDKIEKCGILKVEKHPEVAMVYYRQKHQRYYNNMAGPEANVIVLR